MTIFGLAVDNLTIAQTLARVESLVSTGRSTGRSHRHVTIDVHKTVTAARDRRLADVINRSDLVSADGMPVVWASRLLRRPIAERVTGIDLFDRLLGMASRHGWTVYFLGAEEMVLANLTSAVQQRYPALQVVGARNGYWKLDDDHSVAEAVRAAAPHILFIGMTFPKAECFLAEYGTAIDVPYSLSVGGSFDVIAGKVTRAPLWMQRRGLEWLWRVLQEPRRLGKRYFVDAIYFVRLLSGELICSVRL